MKEIDVARQAVLDAVDMRRLEAMRVAAAQVAALLEEGVVRQRRGEPGYETLRRESVAAAKALAGLGDLRSVSPAINRLEHSCQACHDVWQFAK